MKKERHQHKRQIPHPPSPKCQPLSPPWAVAMKLQQRSGGSQQTSARGLKGPEKSGVTLGAREKSRDLARSTEGRDLRVQLGWAHNLRRDYSASCPTPGKWGAVEPGVTLTNYGRNNAIYGAEGENENTSHFWPHSRDREREREHHSPCGDRYTMTQHMR